jgi:hypothetical protein
MLCGGKELEFREIFLLNAIIRWWYQQHLGRFWGFTRAFFADGSFFAVRILKFLVALSTFQHANALFRALANTAITFSCP